MKRTYLFGLAAVLLSFLSNAWAATYSYTGVPYTTITNFTSPCAIPSCGTYTGAMSISGTITTAAPLAANLTNANVDAQVTAFSFSDGLLTFSSADPNVRLEEPFLVTTDATGQITNMSFLIERWQSGASPHGSGDRFDAACLAVCGAPARALHDDACTTAPGVSTAGVPDSCQFGGDTSDASTSQADAPAAGAWALVAQLASSIPSLSEWGMILLSALLALAALASQRRNYNS